MESSRGGLNVLGPTQPSSGASGSAQPPLPAALSSITSPSGYVFPPIWSFPPFFTPQPNAATHAHQTTLWTALILSWARWHRVFELRAADDSTLAAVFENKAIKRRCGREYQRQLMQALVVSGQATPLPPLPPRNSKESPAAILLYWRTPDEWATIIYGWVSSTGQTNSILTFAELQSEEGGKNFHDLPLPLMRSALALLVKQGKAQVFKVPSGDDGEEGEGVKFA